jgi:uncharacterized protein (DUF2252 family)
VTHPVEQQGGVRFPASIVLFAALACDVDEDKARGQAIVSRLVQADQGLLSTRPDLVADKYERMTESDYSFFRGSFAVYLGDVVDSGEAISQSEYMIEAYPFGPGDAHFENFGTLRDSRGQFALEINDFDAADRYLYLWELRRLAVALVLAADASNPDDETARRAAREAKEAIAHASAAAYATAIVAFDGGAKPERIESAGNSEILRDAFERSVRDEEARRELQERTEIVRGARRLRRGSIDEDDPTNVYLDVAPFIKDAIPNLLLEARATLSTAPEVRWFSLKDVVREFGSGVASLPRVRLIALVEGPTGDVDDDVLLELKEIGDSGALPLSPPGVNADSISGRIERAKQVLWSRPDAEPLLSTGSFFGLTIQVRGDFDAYKTLRVRRLEEELGTPDELVRIAEILGRSLAGVHSRSPSRAAIATILRGNEEAFASEQAKVALDYATRVQRDRLLFVRARNELGPTLGYSHREEDRPTRDQQALFGTRAW